jgi:hypothetical protein
MGRTIPSFRLALEMEEREWKPFRNALDKSACSYSVQTVRLYPILMSILLYHFKQLTQCISEAERIEAKLNSSKNKGSTKEKEEEQLAQPTAMPQQLQGQLRLSEFCNLNDVDQ